MMMFTVILKKELLDALRDGKSMATAFFIPVVFALVSYGSTLFVASVQKGTESIELPVHNAALAAPLIDYLQEQGVTIVPAPASPEEAVRNREATMVLIIPDEFPDDFRAQKAATINLLSDHSRTQSRSQVGKVRGLIEQWSMGTGALRLITRNISPGIARPVQVNSVNVSSDQRLASKVLAGLPMFILMIAFASGIGLIADMASGERERRSLEPLLINPVSHHTIFFGKWTAALCVTAVVSAIGIALQFVSIHLSPMAELGIRIDMGIDKFIIIFLVLVPVMALAVALQLFVAFFARSFKDAQSYNSLIIMLPMAPGLYLTFNAGSAELWQMFVPVLGPTAIFVDVISGDGVNLLYVMIASLVSLAAAGLCAAGGIHLLKREKTIFG